MAKQFIIGNGVRVTESEDMGIFIHFKSKSGNESGQFLGNTSDTPGHLWAKELLEDQQDVGNICDTCFQFDFGQTGEYPCPKCGLPTIWDDVPERMTPEQFSMMQNG